MVLCTCTMYIVDHACLTSLVPRLLPPFNVKHIERWESSMLYFTKHNHISSVFDFTKHIHINVLTSVTSLNIFTYNVSISAI